MSTLFQVEAAVFKLPPKEQWSLLVWLQHRLEAQTGPAIPDPVQIFRQLQPEVSLTTEKAAVWKQAVIEARH